MAPRNWDGRYRRVAPTNVAKKKKEICEREWRRSLTWDIVHLLLLYTHIRKKEKSVCASIFIYIYLSDANTQKSWNSQAGVNRLPSFSHWMKKRRTSFPIGRERERERERPFPYTTRISKEMACVCPCRVSESLLNSLYSLPSYTTRSGPVLQRKWRSLCLLNDICQRREKLERKERKRKRT